MSTKTPPSAGLEPATSGLEVPRAAIAPRRLIDAALSSD
eukprot:CAMPEP_0172400394 /NCGR_PEP_ID=MMETSP1061-20121228/45750_1 /TAXON_ID=37318 /ORGANISM="Pseudo-nitzschia pungens, Strain cf. pungens" /LENGTH=38 /DNA_ID= /DNA_START= /DNA_END= /DNA_ORIENTATION=